MSLTRARKARAADKTSRREREQAQEQVFVTRHQLAERCGTTIETIKRRQAKGLYIAYKLGKHVRYKLSDIVAFENAGRI